MFWSVKPLVPQLPVIVVAGVSGSGKSVVGEALARRLGCPFQEGDAFHPAANVAKMHAGEPLTDADRAPWLDRVGGWIAAQAASGESGVISCSALRRAYRDRLRAAGGPALRFVLLDPPAAELRRRLAARTGHFMPASLLDSQLVTLEEPGAEEDVLRIEAVAPVEVLCDLAIDGLGLTGRLTPPSPQT